MNQCDGCKKGMPILEGIHRLVGGELHMVCTRNKYPIEEKKMTIAYVVNDTQGRTVGIFDADNLELAKGELISHSYCIIDRPELRAINMPDDDITLFAVFEDGERCFSKESDGLTIQKFEVNQIF